MNWVFAEPLGWLCHFPGSATWPFLGLLGGIYAFFGHAFCALSPARIQIYLGGGGACVELKGQEEGVESQLGLCSPAGPSPQRDCPPCHCTLWSLQDTGHRGEDMLPLSSWGGGGKGGIPITFGHNYS